MTENDLFALPFPDLWALAYENEDPLALAVLEQRVALMQTHDPAMPDHDRRYKRAHKERLMAMPLFSLAARCARDPLSVSVFKRRIYSLKDLCLSEALALGKTRPEAAAIVREVVGTEAEETQEKAARGDLERAVDQIHALAARSSARPVKQRAQKRGQPFKKRKRQEEKRGGDEAIDKEIDGNR